MIESFVISDILKHYYNSARRPNDVFFWRDQTGHEVDVIIQQHNKLMPIEIKTGTTLSKNYFDTIMAL